MLLSFVFGEIHVVLFFLGGEGCVENLHSRLENMGVGYSHYKLYREYVRDRTATLSCPRPATRRAIRLG